MTSVDARRINDAFTRAIMAADHLALRQVSQPVNINDTRQFPNIAAAGEHLARMTPERRAELEQGW